VGGCCIGVVDCDGFVLLERVGGEFETGWESFVEVEGDASVVGEVARVDC
jgi:hypothetical protein